MTSRPVSTKEAAELIKLLSTTPSPGRADHWPSLLTLLTSWASHLTAAKASPARPWERRQQPQQHQQQQGRLQTSPVQQLLQEAVGLVQEALHDAATQACDTPGGTVAAAAAAAAVLSKLFVPALSFLTAAVPAITDPYAQQYQQSMVAAACEAATALAAAPAALLLVTGVQQQGLPAVLSSCKALLLVCRASAEQSAWMMACLLSALHTAIHNTTSYALQQLQRQQVVLESPGPAAQAATYPHASNSSSSSRHATDAGVTTGAGLDIWLQQQARLCAVSTTLALLSGLYGLGHDLGVSCCRSAVAGPQAQLAAAHTPQHHRSSMAQHDTQDSSSSRAAGPVDSGVHVLQALVCVLDAACNQGGDALLLGLSASVAAGMCAGVLQALPAQAAAAAGLAPAQHAVADFAAAWGGVPKQPGQLMPQSSTPPVGASRGVQHQQSGPLGRLQLQQHHSHKHQDIQQQQQQQDRAPLATAQHHHSSGRQQLQQQAQLLLEALQAACSRCQGLVAQADATTGADAATAAVGQGLLGQGYGRLMSTCAQWMPSMLLDLQQQQGPSAAGLVHGLHYLTHHCCSLSGMFYFSAGCHNAAAATSWLSAQQQQHPAQQVGLLARWLAAAATAGAAVLPGEQLLQLLSALKMSGSDLARSYSNHLLLTPAAVAAKVDAAAVRQQLDRNFALHVAVLSEVWQACSTGRLLQHPSSSSTPAAACVTADTTVRPGTAASMGGAPLEAAGGDLSAAVAAVSLGDLAVLQFCRVQMPAYVDLVKALVTGLASSTDGHTADAFLTAALPCYERLIQGLPLPLTQTQQSTTAAGKAVQSSVGCGSRAGADSPTAAAVSNVPAVWLRDNVTAAELSFLLPLLPVAVRGSRNAAAAAEHVLPLLLLLLPHPLPGVAQAAHASFAGLLAVAAAAAQQQQDEQPQQSQGQQPSQEDLACSVGDDCGAVERQDQVMQVVQRAVPMYLERTLFYLPDYGSLEGLSASYYSLLRNLPAGSMLGLLAAKRLADKALQLATLAAATADLKVLQQDVSTNHQQRGSSGTAATSAATSSPGVAVQVEPGGEGPLGVAGQLIGLLVVTIQLGDYQLLPAVLQTVADCVLAAPAPVVVQQWMLQLYAGCLAVGDYTRKTALVAWFDQLQKQLLQMGQGGNKGVRVCPGAAGSVAAVV